MFTITRKSKGKKTVNTIQETLNLEELFRRLLHLSFIFGYSVCTASCECISGHYIVSIL